MSVQGKQVQSGIYEFDYMRTPTNNTRWQNFRNGIYNPSENTILGRTGKSWGVVGLFYLCFFSVLALFFAICMKGLLASLSDDRPRWTLESSLIGTNPGVGFRPIAENGDERSLIWYSVSNTTQVHTWIRRLDKFLENYINSSHLSTGGKNQQACSYEQSAKPGNICAVDAKNWGPCSPQEGYGFKNSTPCIFIKLNRIYGWRPVYYNDTKNLPKDMPTNLVEHIKRINSSWLNTVWVSCKNEDPADSETIGELEYYPKIQGFPGYYFPYENTPGYLSPLIAVHFLRPTRNVIINVECRAWAKNINYSSVRMAKEGSVHFELMIDD